ncbi:MAG: CBS domain-containing protein [Nitrosopumilus sp.]|uniref:CBS domain-containing protein n=1 Tax=Nitrosopumilus sp. TaxID=2024843 RepID=UPI0024728E91|nr:CBS domain-containing protein [Nitrosopumilus sp.]MDH5430729.1 CBS domain-containing protein [Nitrosopumilus sp.]MDH5665618.1 CBS domain-containing protein [Nitrosopumilus sp.]MDH5696998.1 CBS domain-containing protein [Nitrosopumilus sp.]
MTDAKTITIGDVMTKSVISVDATLTINETAKMMEDGKVGAVIVMENNIPVGIVTDRDFSIKVAAHAYQITEPVKQIMSSPLFSINSDEPVRDAADLMHERKIRKLPVIDNGKVVGIITATDIVNLLAVSVEEDMRDMYFHSVAKIYTNYSPYN